MRAVQPGQVPEHLLKTGKKQGTEFDANRYFTVLKHISMRADYTLDYVYHVDDLGAFPTLYARPMDEESGTSSTANGKLPDFRGYLEVDDSEAGYLEYVVLHNMGGQFYLSWHASYNDVEIVCNRQAVDEIITRINSSNFGSKLDLMQQIKARNIKNIEPVVRLTGDMATVKMVVFTKWGGFYRLTYTINRTAPHKILDIQTEDLVPYDCGVIF